MSPPRLIGIGRQVSALRALLAYGVTEPAASALVEFRVPAGAPAEPGQTLRLRIMRGGHVDVFRVVHD